MTTYFTPAQLDRLVADALPKIPVGHTQMVVGSVDKAGTQVVAGFTLGKDQNWQFAGAFRHEWTGNNAIGAQAIWSR